MFLADNLRGADGAVHMCEEIANASTVVPRSMIISIALNGVLGFSMLLAVLFCIGDIEIIAQAIQNTSGSVAMVALIEVLVIFATVAMLCGTSRMTWAFARDKGLPGSRWLARGSATLSVVYVVRPLLAGFQCIRARKRILLHGNNDSILLLQPSRAICYI